MLRENLKIFKVIIALGLTGFLQAEVLYHSQFGQDQYLHKNVYGDKRDGVFVDGDVRFFQDALKCEG